MIAVTIAPERVRSSRPVAPQLIAKYDRQVPRYTSYPTAPHFTPAVGADTYAEWLGAVPANEALSLYLHVPFCAELCYYCGCHTTVARRYAPVAAYVDLIDREIALVAARLGEGRPVRHIHWGGGTPTRLSPDDFGRLARTLRAHFDIEADAETAVEVDPRTLSIGHIDAFAAAGVNRASLGVQDFDPAVQQTINRIQGFAETDAAARALRAIGVSSLSIDLMYGLPRQTEATVAATAETALRLAPDRIALFGYAHVPWMKRHQALIPEALLPDAEARIAQAGVAAAALTGAGYVAIGLDHFARPGDPLAEAGATGRLHRNFQGYTTDTADTLIAFGTSAIGKLPQGYLQNAPSTVDYRTAIDAGRLATVRGIALSAEDRMRADAIERLMCDLSVDLAAIAAAHDREPDVFAPELARIDAMADDGIAARDGFRVAVPEAARPFLRTVAAVFDRYLEPEARRHSRAY